MFACPVVRKSDFYFYFFLLTTCFGMKFGLPRLVKPKNRDEVYKDWFERRITAKQTVELTNLKRAPFYKLTRAERNA